MIEALRHEELVNKVGGHFKLAVLIQRRWLQLIQGARPMVDDRGMTAMEVIVKEIMEGKICLEEVEPSEAGEAAEE